MKKCFLFAVILLAAVSFSCEDSLSPKKTFGEEYALYCILNADSTIQTAYISRSYDIEGFNPLENKTDPALVGVDIKITINNRDIYKFNDSAAKRSDTSRYKTEFKYYSMNKIKINDFDIIEITATLANGKTLKSSSIAPPVSSLFFENSTINYFPNPNVSATLDIILGWEILGTQFGNTQNYFLPQLDIVYSKSEAPDKLYRVKVPKEISFSTGAPINQKISTAKKAYFHYEAIVQTLKSISEGDPNKSNYIIHDAEFTLLFLDKNIASYLTTEITFKDEFSVRIDAADFSNIQNGYGLFGVYATRKSKVNLAKSFINTFGYGLL